MCLAGPVSWLATYN